jgi:ADP-ribose pyrophosphatase
MRKRIRRDYVYRAKHEDDISFVIDTIQLPNGQEAEYAFVDSPYRVLAVVAIDDDSNIVLIRQYRYVVDEVLLEVPSGSPVSGETLVQGARRELAEETGVEASNFRELGEFYTSIGITNQRVTAFLATNLKLSEQNLDEMEEIDVLWMPLARAVELAKKGAVSSQTSALAILLASLHLQSVLLRESSFL